MRERAHPSSPQQCSPRYTSQTLALRVRVEGELWFCKVSRKTRICDKLLTFLRSASSSCLVSRGRYQCCIPSLDDSRSIANSRGLYNNFACHHSNRALRVNFHTGNTHTVRHSASSHAPRAPLTLNPIPPPTWNPFSCRIVPVAFISDRIFTVVCECLITCSGHQFLLHARKVGLNHLVSHRSQQRHHHSQKSPRHHHSHASTR
eukprot:COSAG01_NODE_138_length_24329_cov_45.428229_10_plen_204_part_00